MDPLDCRPAALPAAPSVPAVLAALAACATVGGCATGPNRSPADPLEPLNRATWRVNDVLDRNIAQPVARGYKRVVPAPLRTGVDNFFDNLGDVTVMLNDFAQLRMADGMSDLTRIAVNTTFGIGGLFDVASRGGVPKHDQDFGLTLGHYGVPSGPYLVLPLFGPSTVRDAAGFGVDQTLAPANWMDPAWRNSLWGLDYVSTRARYLNASNLLEDAAIDRYLFVRDAYLGRRSAQLEAKTAAKAAAGAAAGAAPAAPGQAGPDAGAAPPRQTAGERR